MRAHLLAAALCAGLLTLVGVAPARAQGDSVLVRVGGDLAGRQGETIQVPITVDLSGAPGRALGSYRATLRFNPALLEFQGVGGGSFAAPQTNANHAADSGAVLLAAVQPAGASGAVVLFYAQFYVVSDTGQSPVTISFDEMSATATSVQPFENLLLLPFTIVNGMFCKSLGRWGDVNGDGDANSLDALVALSTVVGIPVDPRVMTPALADVDGDGKVTSRDALIILSYAVGLPVTGYRVLLNAPGACGTGAPITIVASPDSVELQVGQSAAISFQVRDSLGRSVTTDTGTVTSSDASVAGWVHTGGGDVVQARAPGVAIFTAQVGPGVAATFKVVVLARRTTWYVDVERARLAPTQLGNQALPMEFIGDALELAHDGDTVRVASGIYEEEVSGNVAVTILGDSTDRPVIDPRGAPSWNSSSQAVDLEPVGGQIVLGNVVVRAGRTFLAAHDVTVRNVRIEGLGTDGYSALETQTAPPSGDAPPARASGPQRSNVPAEPGNVLVDGVVVLADSTSNGIMVVLADTAVIRNSSVTRSHPGTSPNCGTGPYAYGGIVIQQASVSIVHDNVVSNPKCQGIGAFDSHNSLVVGDVGRVTISHNRVTSAPETGISAGGRLVALDHNVVQGTGAGIKYTYGLTVGIHVIFSGGAPDSVTALGDTVANSGGRGFAVDTAGSAVLDSLVIAGTGQDSTSNFNYAIDLENGGHFALSHSHVSNTLQDNTVNIQGETTVIRLHGNHIVGAGLNGISAYCYSCDYDRGGPDTLYEGAPDTLISASDTIVNSAWSGIVSSGVLYTRVDSVVVDSTGAYDGIYAVGTRVLLVNAPSISRVALEGIDAHVDTVHVTGGSIARSGGDGIYAEALRFVIDGVNIDRSTWAGVSSRYSRHMEVRGSSVLRSALSGIWASHVDTLLVTGDSLLGNGTGGGGPGVYLEYVSDSARIQGNAIENNASGIVTVNGSPLVLDSNRVVGSTTTGWYSNNYSAGGRATRNVFLNNGWGVVVDTGTNGSSSLSLARNTFSGNAGGAVVNNSRYGATIDADSNYWGDSRGPTCGGGVTDPNCPSPTTGDLIPTNGVTFFPWLASADPEVAAVSVVRLAQRQVPDARIRPLAAAPPISPNLERLQSRVGRPDKSRGAGGSTAQESPQPRASVAALASHQSVRAAPVTAPRPQHVQARAWHRPRAARAGQAQATSQPKPKH